MKVSKSTIYKLEIERPCGCKIAGDYEDVAYKKARGTAIFTACDKHAEDASLVEELLREVLDKEAAEAKAPEPPAPTAPDVHPRTAAHLAQQQPAAAPAPAATEGAATAPARTLRTTGSNGTAGREQANRSGYGSPAIARGGANHRPQPKQPGQGGGFRRADPNAALSPQAAARVAKTAAAPAASGSLDIDIDGAASEDPRLTNALNKMNLFDGEEGGDEEDFDL